MRIVGVNHCFKDVKLSKSMDHITKIMESYNEMHRKKCQNFINEKVPKFEYRTSIPKLLDVNKTLKKTQIECIESMGFGSFARLQLDRSSGQRDTEMDSRMIRPR